MEVGVASPSAYGWRRTLREGQTGFDRASSVLAPKKSQDQAPYRFLPDAFDQGGRPRLVLATAAPLSFQASLG